MLLYFILCNLLFIPSIFGTNATSKLEHNSTSPKVLHKVDLEVKKTKETLVSEGGIVENTPSLILRKSNNSVFSKELVNSGLSKVVPRKGVEYTKDLARDNHNDIQTTHDNATDYKTIKEKTNSDELSLHKKTTVVPVGPKNYFQSNNKTNVNATTILHKKKSKTTEIRKKPSILSYEALGNMDKLGQNDGKIPAMKSSSKTLVADQMPSPSEESGPTTKVLPMSASRHPGMIMPVVLTILVVPMFAVLGYMALRRGQEAWKNRHYKRMDFLLDGMYND